MAITAYLGAESASVAVSALLRLAGQTDNTLTGVISRITPGGLVEVDNSVAFTRQTDGRYLLNYTFTTLGSYIVEVAGVVDGITILPDRANLAGVDAAADRIITNGLS